MRILSSLIVSGVLDIDTINNAAADTDKFLVADANGVVKFRTGAEVAADIDAASAAGYVPYTGATANVDLGVFTILAQNATIASSGSTGTATINHSSGSGIALNITKGGNGEGLYINKTSGSGNAATILGTLNATTFVKSGGLSTEYLKADGSVSTLTNPITGTGASGQVAYWSGASTQAGNNNLFWDITNGRLGIGTNVPTVILDIAGASNLTSRVRIEKTGTTKVLQFGADRDTSALPYIGSESNHGFSIITNNTERARFDASGNLGLGVVPSAWASGWKAIEITSGGYIASANSTYIEFGQNNYYDGAFKYKVTGAASLYEQISGEHRFYNAPSGSANATITFARPMTLTANGRLLLGSTSEGTQTLQVTGDTLLKGSGATSATTALTVQNSASTNMLRFFNDGQIFIGTTGNSFYPSDKATLATSLSGAGITFYDGSQTTGTYFRITGNNITDTGGASFALRVQRNFVVPSSNGTFVGLGIENNINQTGGANGITRGLYVNPTLTAAADWRSIEWSNNTGFGLYGAGTAANYLNGALTVNGAATLNNTLFVGAHITFYTSIRDNRFNDVITQSVNTLALNRTLTIGNATYSNIGFSLSGGNFVTMPAAIIGTGASTGETFQVNGTMKVTGASTFGNVLQINGAASVPASGGGLELAGNTTTGSITSFNRSLGTYLPLGINTLSYSFNTSGTEKFAIANSGAANFTSSLDVAGKGSFGNTLQIAGGTIAPTSGAGLELGGGSTTGSITSFNRSLGTFLPIVFNTLSYSFLTSNTERFAIASTGAATFSSSVTANSLVKSGGLSTEYLKADGSVSTLTNPITGTGASGQVAYWSGASTQAGNNNLFWDNTNGRLGVGTNVPATNLDILGTSVVNAQIKSSTNTGATSYVTKNDLNASFELGMWGSTRTAFGAIASGNGYVYGTTDVVLSSATFIKFATGVTPIEYMRLTTTGRILLGNVTTDTGQRLQVTGTAFITGATSITNTLSVGTTSGGDISLNTGLTNGSNATPLFTDLNFLGNANGNRARIRSYDVSANSVDGILTFWTNSNLNSFTEKMRIDGNGSVGIGVNSLTGYNLRVLKNITGSTFGFNVSVGGAAQSDVTNNASYIHAISSTQAASFTLPQIRLFSAEQGTFGAGSVVTDQIGFFAQSSLIGATNNFGFYGNIASGTGRWNLYMNGTAANYLNGDLRVNQTGSGNAMIFASTTGKTNVAGIRVGGNTTQSTSYGFFANQNINSTTTAEYASFISNIDIAAGTYTISNVQNYVAQSAVIPIGVTITNMYGFRALSGIIQGTNNYGFFGGIDAATGRWNLYMNGTAANFLSGDTQIGTGAFTSEKLQVNGTMKVTASIIGTPLTLTAQYANGITFINTNAGADNRNFRIISDQSTYADFYIQKSTTQGGSTYTNLLAFDISSAATFSSSVTATSYNATTQNVFSVGGTEGMRLTATNRNLHIGTYSSDSGEKLQVNGTMKVTGASTFGGAITISLTNASLLVTDGTNNSYFATATSNNGFANGTIAGDAVIRSKSGISFTSNDGTSLALRIASTGAATFSSSVQAASLNVTGASTLFTTAISSTTNVEWTNSLVVSGGANGDNSGTRAFFRPSGSFGAAIYGGRWSSTDRGARLVGLSSGSAENAYIHLNGESSEVTIATGGTIRQTIASTGAATFSSSVTATTLVKSGGLSTEYLKADGSVSTLTNPITGTGVAGQVAYWSGASTQAGSNDLFFDSATIRLGIGTATPAFKLDVASASGYNFIVSRGASGQYFETYTNAGTRHASFGSESNGDVYIGSRQSNPLIFITNGNSVGKFDASGNLGLGVTPSAWNTSYKAIDIGNVFSLVGASGAADLYGNLFFNTSNQFIYKTTAAATAYSISGGQHRWYVVASGTAGNTASLTANMTLGNNGNLLLGTTSDSGQRFQVTGDTLLKGSGATSATTALTVQNSASTNLFVVRNDGSVGIGGTAGAASLLLQKTIIGTGSVFGYGVLQEGAVQSNVTSFVMGFYNLLQTQVASFTLNSYHHYFAQQATLGAGSAMNNQYGYFVDATLTGATNNYAFFSNIASGTGRWNLFMNGTAANYLNGNLGVGVLPSAWGTTNSVRALQLTSGSIWNFATTGFYIGQNNFFDGTNRVYVNTNFATEYAQITGSHIWYNAPSGTAGTAVTFTEKMRLDASGRLLLGSGSVTSELLQVNGTMKVTGASTFGGNLNLPNSGEYYIQNAASTTFIGLNFDTPYIRFGVGGTVRAFLNATGLGLGTTSPSARLDVIGTFNVTGASTFGGNMALTTNNTYIYGKDNAGNTPRLLGINSANLTFIGPIDAYAGGEIIYAVSANVTNQRFYTSGSERMRITSGGNTILAYSGSDTGELLQVYGTMKVTGASTFGGNMTLSLNQNAETKIEVSNTTSGTSSSARLNLVSSGGLASLGKFSATSTAFKTIAANDFFIFSNIGDITILNDFASGSIKMAAGGSSTAQFTIASTGAATFSSSVQAASLNVTGASTFGGYTTITNTGGAPFTSQLTLTNSTSSSSLLAFTNTVNGFAFGFNSTTTQRFVFLNGSIAEIASISGTGSMTANAGYIAGTAATSSDVSVLFKTDTGDFSLINQRATHSFGIYDNLYSRYNLNFSGSGAATFSSTIRSTQTNGFAIGGLTNVARIQYGSDAATSFSLLTDANAFAGLYASSAVFSSNVTMGDNLIVGTNAATIGAMNFIRTNTSPVASRITFGTDGTGYSFAIGKNQAGTVTDLFSIFDSGAATFSSTVTAVSLGVNVSTIRTRSEIAAILAAPTALNTNVSAGNLLLSDGGNIGLVMGLYDTSFDSYIQARNNLGSNNVAYNLLLNPLGGNIIIGSTTNSGESLQVNGSAKLTGKLSATSAVTSAVDGDNTLYALKTYTSASTISNVNLYSSVSSVFYNLTGGAFSGNATYNVTSIFGLTSVAGNTGTQSTQPIRSIMAGIVGKTGSSAMNLADFRFFEAKAPDPDGVSGHVIANIYGLRIDTLKGTSNYTITNGWGIYQEGASDNNYFAGNVSIGTTSFGTSATKTISISSGTAPSSSPVDGFQMYSNDVTAGNAAPHFRTENGAVVKLYQETTGVGNAIFSAGGGTGVLDDSTFDGYTLRQIVKALRNQGILA